MVQPAFNIGNDSPEGLNDCYLLIEVSGQCFNYILYTKEPRQLVLLRQYRVYTTSDRTTRDILEEIISGDRILQQYARKAIVVYNFPDANILPSELHQPAINNEVMQLICGYIDNDFVFDEQVKDLSMHNVYSVSKEIHGLCKEKFKDSSYWHFYTILLLWSKHDALKHGNLIRVIFYNDKFVAAFFRNGQLQLLQTFSYQTPEDAAYYLLLICRQFKVKQEEMLLNVSGLIDTQSALYTELLKYFPEVTYEGIPESYDTGGLLDEYPSHYFSPLLKMSLCV